MRLPSSYRYFDYAAGWPVREEALTAYVAAVRQCGNPGSVHRAGQRALASLDESRGALACALGCEPGEVVLAGSATEANNLAVRGTVQAFRDAHPGVLPRIIVSALEHDSVRAPAEELVARGEAELAVISVDRERGLDIKALEASLDSSAALVSVMQVSNETGTLLPIARVGRVVQDHRGDDLWPRFHVDASQALASVEELATAHADLVTYSGYKAGAAPGAAALVVRERGCLWPLVVGGGQEGGLRAGTEDVAAAASFSCAARLVRGECAVEVKRLEKLRAALLRELAERAPRVEENVPNLECAPHIVSLWVPGVKAQETLARLDLAGFAVGAGSACSARSLEPSKALLALGYDARRAGESVRISFGPESKEGDIEELAQVIGA